MKSISALPLIAAFTAEHSALLSFVALLEQEQAMLIDNATDQLITLSNQKSRDALNLNKLSLSRQALLQNVIPQLSLDSIQTWLKNNNAEGWAIWQKILPLAKRSQQLNRANGELIQMKLRNNQQALTVLNIALNKASLYSSDGQPNFAPSPGRSLGSG